MTVVGCQSTSASLVLRILFAIVCLVHRCSASVKEPRITENRKGRRIVRQERHAGQLIQVDEDTRGMRSPGEIDGWIQERGRCVKKGTAAGVIMQDIDAGGNSISDCAKACEKEEACAAFDMKAEDVDAGEGDCILYKELHVGDKVPGRLCYINQKFAEQVGAVKNVATPKPTMSAEELEKMEAEMVPGKPGPPGAPGKDGKDLSGHSTILFIIVAMFLNLAITGYLFSTLSKSLDAGTPKEADTSAEPTSVPEEPAKTVDSD